MHSRTVVKVAIVSLALAASAAGVFAQQAAPANPATAPRGVPPLMFKEVWKVPQAAIDNEATHFTRRVVPESVTNPQLELRRYGQHAYGLEIITHRAGGQDLWNGFSIWTGYTPAPVAFLLRDKSNFADLTGLARMRAAVRTNALHMLHPAVKLADGTLLAGNRGITTEGTGFVQAEVVFDSMRWYRLDPVTVTVLALVPNPDLSKVDEVGFADLMPAGGPDGGGWTNTSTIELYARPVPR